MKKNFRRRAGNADCKIETSIRKIKNRRRQEKFPLIPNNSQVPLIINKCLSEESLFLSISNDSLANDCSKLPLKPANSKQVVEITGIDSRFPEKKPKNSEFIENIRNSNFRLKNNFQKWTSSPDIFLDGVTGDSLDAADENGDKIPLIEDSEGQLTKNHKKIEENEEKNQFDCNLKEKFLENCGRNGKNGELPEKSEEIKGKNEEIPLMYNLEKKLCRNHKKIEENEGEIPLICNSKEKVLKNRRKIGENEELAENYKKIEENEEKKQLIYNSEEKLRKNHKKIEENEEKIKLICNSEEKILENCGKIAENDDFKVKNGPEEEAVLQEEKQDDEEVKGKRKLEEFCLRHLQRSKALGPSDDVQPKKNHLLLKKVTIDELQQKFNDIRARLDQQPCDYVIKEDLPKKFSGCPCKVKSGRPRKVSFHVPPESQVDFSKKKPLSKLLGPPKMRIDECERQYFCKEIVSVRKNLRTVRNRLLSRVSSVNANCEELILKRDEDWEIDGAIYDDARGIMFPKETRKAMTVIQYIQRNYSEKLTKGEIK